MKTATETLADQNKSTGGNVGNDCPLVCAIIINWNNYSDTSECLDSLEDLDYGNLMTIVVDNASTDGSPKRLCAEYAWPEYILSEENHGFAAGCNKGIERAREIDAEYVLILNNDVIIPDSEFISNLVSTCSSDDDVGIVSPLIREYPDIEGVWFERGEISWPSASARHKQGFAELNEEVTENDYIPLCGALIKCEVFDEVGLIDEQYFLYYEDVDFCYRAKKAGYRILTDRTVELYHKENKSTGDGFKPLGSYYTARNRFVFARNASRLSVYFFISYIYWLTTRSVYRAISGHVYGSVALLQGAIDGLLGKSGRGPYP